MKNLRYLLCLVLFIPLLACNQTPNEELPFKQNLSQATHRTNNSFPSNTQRGFKAHQFRDARTGIVVNTAEYPASWDVISKPIYTMDQKFPTFLIQIEGPNHLHTFNTPIKPYISYQNPQTYQFMTNATYANMHRPLMSNQAILQEEIQGRMLQSGFTYVGNQKMSRIENYLREQIAKQGSNAYLDMLSTVWKNAQGQKAMVSITKIAMQQPLSSMDIMTLWFYSIDYVFVDSDQFDKTINQLEESVVTSTHNPEWKQYVNTLIQQRARQSAIQHQQNMANRQASFEAHQRKMQGIWAAQDANHAAFMNSNFGPGSSTAQREFVNMINEEETVYNPLTQETYQVNAGSLEYWMDSDGNYIQNNNLFYTPNGDINLNNREWVRVK